MKKSILTLITVLLAGVSTAWGDSHLEFEIKDGLLGLSSGEITYNVISKINNSVDNNNRNVDSSTEFTSFNTAMGSVTLTTGTSVTVTFTFGANFVPSRASFQLSHNGSTTNLPEPTSNLAGGTYIYNFTVDDVPDPYIIRLSNYIAHDFTITPSTTSTDRVEISGPASENEGPTYTLTDNVTSSVITNYNLITITGTEKSTTMGEYEITFTPVAGSQYGGKTAQTLYWKRILKKITDDDIDVTIAPVTYDGTSKTPVITVKIGDTPVDESYYTVTTSASSYTNAQTYVDAITITGTNGYSGTIKKDFTIAPRNINDVTVTGNSFAYTGSAIEATTISGAITLTYGGATLSKATDGDYSITVATGTYKDPGTYPGVITLTAVEGAGKNFVGSRTIDLIIQEAINIADCDITATTVYNGTEQTPAATVVVKRGSTTLVADTDYEITYAGTPNFTNAGTTEITITGKAPSCYGSTTVNYIISPKNIADCAITTSTPYTGETITPADKITVKDGDTNLAKETDYNLTVSAGTYKDVGVYPAVVTITGIGNYTGEVTRDFSITSDDATDISTALVTSTAVYNGANQAPSASTVIVKIGSNIIASENYDVTFTGEAADYKDAKTYANAVIITPKSGNTSYYGSLTADYVIEPYNIAGDNVKVTAADMTWTGGVLTKNQSTIDNIVTDGYTITFNNGTSYVDLVKTTDYNITSVPEVIKNEGEYSLVFEGVGNFTGTKSTKFDVLKDLSDNTTNGIMIYDIPTQIMLYQNNVTDVADIANATYTLNKLNIQVKDANSHELLYEDEDYTLEYYSEYTDETTNTPIVTDHPEQLTLTQTGNPTSTETGNLEKKYIVKITGTGTKYTGSKILNFYTLAEYQKTVANVSDIDPKRILWYRISTTNPGYPTNATPGANSLSTAKGQVTVGAPIGAAINKETNKLTIPAGNATLVGDKTIEFDVVGIEKYAFAGCNVLRWMDIQIPAETWTPISLDRTIADSPFYGVPKQALVYLNGNTITGENYVYKKSVTEYVCDVFKIYDDVNGNQQGFTETDGYKWAYENLYPFTANTIENTRQMKAGQHYTVCLPYALAIPSTLKAYTLDASSSTILGFKEVTGMLEAFTPYVVIASGTGNLLSISTGGQVPATTFASDDAATRLTPAGTTNYVLVGTMRYMDGNAAKDNYIMQADKTWKKIEGTTSSYNGPCILPMRAYIAPVVAISGGSARLSATFTNADGSTTAIRDLQLDNDGDDTYDLQGRKVNGQSAAKGVYIKNGKKLYK